MAARPGTIKPKDIDTISRKLGLRRVDCKHHVRLYFEFNGKIICATHISFGRDDIYGRVLRNIAKDLGIHMDLFFGLIDCHKDLGDYLRHLRNRNFL